jgi:hypothetical protein
VPGSSSGSSNGMRHVCDQPLEERRQTTRATNSLRLPFMLSEHWRHTNRATHARQLCTCAAALAPSPWLPLGDVAGSAKVVLPQLKVGSAEVLQPGGVQQIPGRQTTVSTNSMCIDWL